MTLARIFSFYHISQVAKSYFNCTSVTSARLSALINHIAEKSVTKTVKFQILISHFHRHFPPKNRLSQHSMEFKEYLQSLANIFHRLKVVFFWYFLHQFWKTLQNHASTDNVTRNIYRSMIGQKPGRTRKKTNKFWISE